MDFLIKLLACRNEKTFTVCAYELNDLVCFSVAGFVG